MADEHSPIQRVALLRRIERAGTVARFYALPEREPVRQGRV